MANDENKIILEFPATNVEIEFGETITFDNISGFLNSDRVTYNDESLTEEIAHLENDKADNTKIAPEYDEEETYYRGDIVLYNGVLYECDNTDASGEFNPSDWKEITLGEGIEDVRGLLADYYTKTQSDKKFATKTDLEHISPELGFIKTLQRFDKTRILDNTGINGSTGNFNNDINYWVSNFIGIDTGASKVITNEAANGLFFYSDNTYLGRVTSVPANTTIDIPYPTATRLCLRYSKSYTPIIKAKDIILSFGEVLSPTKEMYILQDIVSVKEDIVEINDKLNLIDRNYETRQVIATETMSAGDFIYLDVPDIKKNNQIGFHAIVSTLGKIVLSHGQSQAYSAAKIEVDNTNIYIYGYLANAWTLYNTIAHGLTISNNIDIAIDVNNNLTANVSVSSNGSVFVKEGVIWNGNSQFVQADIESGEYKNCILTFDCPDYNKALWIFGDSYLDMWPQILAVNGIDDYYLDGFSGRNSVAALASFEKAIQFGRPKKLAWFLGMNDRDGKIVNGVSDATGINANWLATFTAVKNWCDNNNVELIACTIPEVPARDHTYKNAYIKSLGIRYVDVAGAVGATTLGSHWYNYGQANAYLANDEVHPSKPYGRNTIAYKMLVDMPEMISDIKMSTYTNGEIDALLLLKADKTTTYTKAQVDDIVYNILPDDTASGSVANFETDLALPLKSLEIDVNALQESGTPTLASPLPISGWSEISLVHCGKNLFNDTKWFTDNGYTLQPDGSWYKSTTPLNVVLWSNTSGYSGQIYIRFQYKYVSENVGFRIRIVYTDDTVTEIYTSATTTYSLREVISTSGKTVKEIKTTYGTNIGSYIKDFSINQTDYNYEPYNGNTEVINLGGTYYGGHFTQDKEGHRQFVATHTYYNLDTLSWTHNANGFWQANKPDDMARCNASEVPQVIAEKYQMQTGTWVYGHGSTYGYFGMNGGLIYITDENTPSGYVVAPLGTPYVIDLPDGEPIITINGTNNIYADTGDSTAVFKCSVAEYVANHSGGGGAKSLGGVFLGGSNSGSEEEPTEESEETEKTKEIDEPKEEIKAIGDDSNIKKLGGE